MRFIAIHLANEQFAEVESLAFRGELDVGSLKFCNGNKKLQKDLDNYGVFNSIIVENNELDEDEKPKPTLFEVTTEVENYKENLKKVSVKVEWIESGKKYDVEFEKIVRVN